jgi:hypothetical protein
MTYILLLITILSNAVMDAIMSNDAYQKYGVWFSRHGWTIKYTLVEWLNKYLPLWLSKFIALNVMVVFTELYKLAKMIMILSFLIAIFGLTWHALVVYFVWGLLFSFVYSIVR